MLLRLWQCCFVVLPEVQKFSAMLPGAGCSMLGIMLVYKARHDRSNNIAVYLLRSVGLSQQHLFVEPQVQEKLLAQQSANTLRAQVEGLQRDLKAGRKALKSSDAACKSCAATLSLLACWVGLSFMIYTFSAS